MKSANRRDPTEEALNALAALRSQPDAADRVDQLRGFLAHRSNLVVGKAAKLAREFRIDDLIPDLVAHFERLMGHPAKLDKGCAATTEIVSALHAMDYLAGDVYLKGIRHVQMEPAYGGPVDVAVQLRANSALGLIRTRHPDAVYAVVDLLVDREPGARAGAARALGALPGDTGALLLRLKVLTGDRDADVIAECFSGILASATDRCVEFVGSYADDRDPAIAEAAILALGGSRSAKAIEVLKEKWRRTARGEIRKSILLALATARQDTAIEFLLSIIREEGPQAAAEALSAMRVHRGDERVTKAIQEVVNERGDDELAATFRSEF